MAIDPRSILQLDPNLLQQIGNPTGGRLTQLGQLYQQGQQNQLANRVALQEAVQAKQKMKILQDEARREQAIDEAQKAYSLSGAYLDAVKDDKNLSLDPKRYEQWMASNTKGLPKSVINRFRGAMPTDMTSIYDKSKRFLQAKGLLDETSVEAYSDFMDIPGQPNFVGQYDLTSGKLVNVKRKEESPLVVNQIGADSYSKQRMKEQATKMTELDKSAQSAYNSIKALDRFIDASPDAQQGSLQPIVTGVQNLFSSFGVPFEGLENVRVMEQSINTILAQYMQELGARGLTDQDMKILKQALPRVETDSKSRETVARILRKAYGSTIENWESAQRQEAENFPELRDKVIVPKWYEEYQVYNSQPENQPVVPSRIAPKNVFDAADSIVDGL